MNYGFILPFGDARLAADLAREAEAAGWDGFFVWEAAWSTDAWISLTAAAMVTQHIRLGTMITPLSRMRPWKLASETATLDHLSGGRVILSVGLGAVDTGFAEFGEVTDRKQRAELLDEGLDVLIGLWRGQPFQYDGQHYHVRPLTFPHTPPQPVQQPRIPIWVVGSWPRDKSMQRAARWDGLLPTKQDENGQHVPVTPDDLRAMVAWIAQHRPESAPFDYVIEGQTPGDNPAQAAAIVQPWIDAGATWWLDSMWETPREQLAQVIARVKQGPPRLSSSTP
jgi:alkanesulfonate monooxygenase SsuD/methylene tetrahydromethanopterin reductase-like flavin-dependent oxidoreductase (luciferase family)